MQSFDPALVSKYAASAVIINDHDHILLLLRDDMPLWTSIGGFVENGEEFEAAMRREVREETGIDIDIIRFVGDFYSRSLDDTEFQQDKVWLCRPVAGAVARLQDEGIALEWFHINDLPFNIGPRYRARLELVFSSVSFPISLFIDKPSMLEFLYEIKDFNLIPDLHDWLNHPIVKHKRIEPSLGANCLIVEARRGEEKNFHACLAPVGYKMDLGGVLRRHLGVRQVSMAPLDFVLNQTQMELGSITPIGLPKDWRVFIDSRMKNGKEIIIGAGLRRSKLKMPLNAFMQLTDATFIEDLAKT